ncbi:hypothetical protein HYV56_02280 [Candidatus Peregrinibacteria bacterium]|nr:hypothetical protein [Candidatus Peregrinibacteria bacterium]
MIKKHLCCKYDSLRRSETNLLGKENRLVFMTAGGSSSVGVKVDILTQPESDQLKKTHEQSEYAKDDDAAKGFITTIADRAEKRLKTQITDSSDRNRQDGLLQIAELKMKAEGQLLEAQDDNKAKRLEIVRVTVRDIAGIIGYTPATGRTGEERAAGKEAVNQFGLAFASGEQEGTERKIEIAQYNPTNEHVREIFNLLDNSDIDWPGNSIWHMSFWGDKSKKFDDYSDAETRVKQAVIEIFEDPQIKKYIEISGANPFLEIIQKWLTENGNSIGDEQVAALLDENKAESLAAEKKKILQDCEKVKGERNTAIAQIQTSIDSLKLVIDADLKFALAYFFPFTSGKKVETLTYADYPYETGEKFDEAVQAAMTAIKAKCAAAQSALKQKADKELAGYTTLNGVDFRVLEAAASEIPIEKVSLGQLNQKTQAFVTALQAAKGLIDSAIAAMTEPRKNLKEMKERFDAINKNLQKAKSPLVVWPSGLPGENEKLTYDERDTVETERPNLEKAAQTALQAALISLESETSESIQSVKERVSKLKGEVSALDFSLEKAITISRQINLVIETIIPHLEKIEKEGKKSESEVVRFGNLLSMNGLTEPEDAFFYLETILPKLKNLITKKMPAGHERAEILRKITALEAAVARNDSKEIASIRTDVQALTGKLEQYDKKEAQERAAANQKARSGRSASAAAAGSRGTPATRHDHDGSEGALPAAHAKRPEGSSSVDRPPDESGRRRPATAVLTFLRGEAVAATPAAYSGPSSSGSAERGSPRPRPRRETPEQKARRELDGTLTGYGFSALDSRGRYDLAEASLPSILERYGISKEDIQKIAQVISYYQDNYYKEHDRDGAFSLEYALHRIALEDDAKVKIEVAVEGKKARVFEIDFNRIFKGLRVNDNKNRLRGLLRNLGFTDKKVRDELFESAGYTEGHLKGEIEKPMTAEEIVSGIEKILKTRLAQIEEKKFSEILLDSIFPDIRLARFKSEGTEVDELLGMFRKAQEEHPDEEEIKPGDVYEGSLVKSRGLRRGLPFSPHTESQKQLYAIASIFSNIKESYPEIYKHIQHLDPLEALSVMMEYGVVILGEDGLQVVRGDENGSAADTGAGKEVHV